MSNLLESEPSEQVIQAACTWIVAGVVIAGLVVSIMYKMTGTPAEIALRAKNKVLRKQLNHTKRTVKKFRQQLKTLSHDDNKLYRSVLGMKKISHGEREAGAGGADIYAKYDVYGKKTANILKWTSKHLKQMERTIKIQKASFAKIERKYNTDRKKFKHIPAIKPVAGPITSGFGMRYHPILHHMRFHKGVDIGAPVGTKIYASAAGVVKHAGPEGTYGNLIIIDDGYGYETYYAHLSAIAKGIKPGVNVKRGEKIGLVGQTGLTTGPHLHYEVHKNGKAVNPIIYFYANTTPSQFLKYKRMAEKSTKSMD
ncbi:MAG TPA: M23 family metallopeptidase [Balneolaceae bacterium]|nr:M23 family metallopeptidase [Balneolaceae bacterium]